MAISSVIIRLAELIRTEGLVATMRKVLTSVRARIMRRSDRQWEDMNQVMTIEEITMDSLNIAEDKKKHGFTYVPSFRRLIHNLIWNVERQLKSSPYQLSDFTFIDFGSGKGQALMTAAEYPFKELLGVEFSNELHQVAVRNLEQYKEDHPESPPIQSVNIDATEYDIPDGPCLLYFYNPFDESVMLKVIKSLHDRQKKTTHPVYILYAQLRIENPLHATKNIALIKEAGDVTAVRVAYRSLIDWFLLGSHLLSINYLPGENERDHTY